MTNKVTNFWNIKYNVSVNNTTLYLYTKIVYFRATCFDLIRSSSGPPRRQIQLLDLSSLYTTIVYFVRATCFNLIRSSSGPPRRQIQFLDLSSLYTKIVYFVRATCFDLIRSSSGPPRRQIQFLDLSSLYIKIVYFVRATCFDLIRSYSGPPRRQIQLWQNILYLYINKLLSYRLTYFIYIFITIRDGKHQISGIFSTMKTVEESCGYVIIKSHLNEATCFGPHIRLSAGWTQLLIF